MNGDDDVAALVPDEGSGMCKAGFAGDDAPRYNFRSAIASDRKTYARVGVDGVVTAIEELSTSAQPTSEWKICKPDTKIGSPY
ncbi:hypothetical protein ACIP66_03830 [Pseudomonas sp. NPDC088429]|uniref:hypothetical protein n=1 Tax=Pseudomonas sp. NPDC088429 TaxID=3364455 RepID=UPI0037F24519